MVLPTVDVSWVAVIVVAIISFVIGMLWYSPLLFGKQWMKLSDIGDKKMKEMKKKGMERQWSLHLLVIW